MPRRPRQAAPLKEVLETVAEDRTGITTSHPVNEIRAAMPSVGIFWGVRDGHKGVALVIDATPLEHAEPYVHFLTHAGGHYDVLGGLAPPGSGGPGPARDAGRHRHARIRDVPARPRRPGHARPAVRDLCRPPASNGGDGGAHHRGLRAVRRAHDCSLRRPLPQRDET